MFMAGRRGSPGKYHIIVNERGLLFGFSSPSSSTRSSVGDALTSCVSVIYMEGLGL